MTQLSVYDFGRRLLDTKDLDPIYVFLWEARLEKHQLRKWLLAYWCFYHSGTASWITDGDFWSRMEQAAASKDYPRCPERRHFRGENARRSVAWLAERGLDRLYAPLVGKSLTVAETMKQVQTWVGFGPWIAFKVADMLERLALSLVDFSDTGSWLYESPKQGAELVWERYGKGERPKDVGGWAIGHVSTHLGHTEKPDQAKDCVLAPPRYERPINGQEVETILCKWHSHCKGRYHVGEDVTAARKGLLRYAKTETAQRLLAAGKVGGLW